MMRRRAGLDTDQATRQLLEEGQYVAPLELTTHDHIALRIDAVNLKNRLRYIQTDCRDGFHDLAPPNRGSLDSTHIQGTRVPVEEPSTASLADIAAPSLQRQLVDLPRSGSDAPCPCAGAP